jgi:hypothetical protein
MKNADPKTIIRMIKQLQDVVLELPEGVYVIQLIKLDSKSTENSLMRHIRFTNSANLPNVTHVTTLGDKKAWGEA